MVFRGNRCDHHNREHGGGYVSGSGANYLPLAADISTEAKCAVLLIDYRLAPEHPFPAGLEDCIRSHEWMIVHGPYGPAPGKATFIGGDSAGGGLTLATLLALRDRGRPLPVAGIPPLLIQVGEYEVIRDDSIHVAAKAETDGVDLKLEVWPGQVHVFQIRELPESREAIEHIAAFMRHSCCDAAPAAHL